MSTILVIDDEKGYGTFLNRYLTVLGFDPFVVATGDEGLELTKTVHPDLILLDWCLKKGVSAEETLRQLKSQPQTQGVPVVVISGLKESAEDEMRARRAGAAQFITKNEIADSAKEREVFTRRLQALILGRRHPAGKRRAPAMKKPTLPRAVGRVLLIDDDQEMRDMVCLFLRKQGYTVLTAETGVLGLSKARDESPDLVILDLGLPDMDGLEVCTQLKAYPRTRALPILLLTARASTQAQLLAAEYGADHYFTKPIPDIDEFHNWVAAFMRRKTHLDGTSVIRVGDSLVIDMQAHTLTVNGRVIEKMPATLFRLLCEFARKPGEVLSRDYLVHRVWHDRVREHNVDTNVCRLKSCLGEAANDWFICVPGNGFRMLPVSAISVDKPA